jgi:hypothetical protein
VPLTTKDIFSAAGGLPARPGYSSADLRLPDREHHDAPGTQALDLIIALHREQPVLSARVDDLKGKGDLRVSLNGSCHVRLDRDPENSFTLDFFYSHNPFG